MGTLRLKRGTKTALQTNPGFTPAEGELVYTTDSKEVFVGDGVTQGGIAVSVSTQNLEDLGNVQALAAQKDQILVYNGSNWAATENPALDVRGNIYGDDSTLLVDAINGKIVGPVDTSSVTATSIVGNLVGDTTGSHIGTVVGNVVGTLTGDLLGSVFADDSTAMVDAQNKTFAGTLIGEVNGQVTGDLTGSVFADDSSLLVDSVNGTFNGNLTGAVTAVRVSANTGTLTLRETSTASNNRIEIKPTRVSFKTDSGSSEIQSENHDYVIDREDNVTRLNFTRISTDGSAIPASTAITRLTFGRKLGTNDAKVILTQSISEQQWTLTPAPDGVIDYAKTLRFHNQGKLGINGTVTAEPDANLHVTGNVKISGGELLLGNMDETTRDALTASNGMMIYNTTANKFQGYENGAWVNLI